MGNKILVFLLIAIIILAILVENTRRKQEIATLRVGHVQNFPPYWYNSHGMDKDIIEQIAIRIGYGKVEYLASSSFDTLYQSLAQGEVDVIASNLWRLPDKIDSFLFSIPYKLLGGPAVMWKEGSSVSALAHSTEKTRDFASLFRNKRVGLLRGTNLQYWLKELGTASIFVEYPNTESLLQAAIKEEVDLIVEQQVLMLYLVKEKNLDQQFQSLLIRNMPASFATRLDNCSLHNAINNALYSMWNDGSLFRIKEKYFGPLNLEPIEFSPFVSLA